MYLTEFVLQPTFQEHSYFIKWNLTSNSEIKQVGNVITSALRSPKEFHIAQWAELSSLLPTEGQKLPCVKSYPFGRENPKFLSS